MSTASNQPNRWVLLLTVPLAFAACAGDEVEGEEDDTGEAPPAQELTEDGFPVLAALGPPPIPTDNPQTAEKIELGMLLYFDNRLSGDASLSCATCHDPRMGWTDGSDICRGYPGTIHWRNCQTIVNTAYYNKLFWAGAATSLESQAPSAALGAVAGNGENDVLQERLRQIPEYVRRFNDVFGTERPEILDAWRAMASFERTLVQRDTPFDNYMNGDEDALSEQARRGMELFEGRAGCIRCHNGAFFTDERYYNLGIPENDRFQNEALLQITFRFEQYAKGVPESVYRNTHTDLGLFYRTRRPEDMGKFRTPTLRYLTYSAPYMHNGVFYELEEVVNFYNEGGGDDAIEAQFEHRTRTDLLEPLGLDEQEVQDLVAFLESLTGDEIIVDPPELPEYAVMEE